VLGDQEDVLWGDDLQGATAGAGSGQNATENARDADNRDSRRADASPLDPPPLAYVQSSVLAVPKLVEMIFGKNCLQKLFNCNSQASDAIF
jgi:hypothetical protein